MRIREVASSDRDEWLRMLMALHPELPAAEHVPGIDAFLTGEPLAELLPSAVFVAERPEGVLAGFAELSVRNYAEGCTGDTPYIESWYVDPDVRRQGVGRQLIAAAEAWAAARGYREVASDALLENVLSHRAHQALGFEEVERVVHFRKTLASVRQSSH